MTQGGAPRLVATGLERTYRAPGRVFGRGPSIHALRGVSFALAPGRTLAVVGESGSGKSTLARLLCLFDQPDAGSLQLEGVELTTLPGQERRRMRRRIQMVFQSPYASLNPRLTIAAILDEPLAVGSRLDRAARRVLGIEWLARVGLEADALDRYPHMFSGGQRQRIAIARAMILQPDVLVADEPVSALDVSVQGQILDLMNAVQRDTGVSHVFVSHDLMVVRHMADEVMVLYLGTAVEQGPAAAIFDAPLHPYTRMLMASAPRLEAPPSAMCPPGQPEAHGPSLPSDGCVFVARCPYAEEVCRRHVPEPQAVEGRLVACHLAGMHSAAGYNPVGPRTDG